MTNPIGLVVVIIGFVDAAVCLLIVLPRVPPEKKTIVGAAILSSAALIVALGGAMTMGLIEA